MKVTVKNMFSGEDVSRELPVTIEQINRWRQGELIQDVFYDLSADEREFILTGMSSEEWKELFKE